MTKNKEIELKKETIEIKKESKEIDIGTLVTKFDTLIQINKNGAPINNPRIVEAINRYGLTLPYENYRLTTLKKFKANEKMKPHLRSLEFLIQKYEGFIGMVSEFSDMATNSFGGKGHKRANFVVVEMKIEELGRAYRNFIFYYEILISHIKYGDGETIIGIVDLKDKEKTTKKKRKLFIGLGSSGIVIGSAVLAAGIVLGPFTGGITLIGAIACASAISVGGISAGVGVGGVVVGSKYHDEELDIRKSIEYLEELTSLIDLIAASIEKSKEIKEILGQDLDDLIYNEVQYMKLFCCICLSNVKDPVMISISDDDFEIYCRTCIHGWHSTCINNNNVPTLPVSRKQFGLEDLEEPDKRSKKQAIELSETIESLKLKMESILTKDDRDEMPSVVVGI